MIQIALMSSTTCRHARTLSTLQVMEAFNGQSCKEPLVWSSAKTKHA